MKSGRLRRSLPVILLAALLLAVTAFFAYADDAADNTPAVTITSVSPDKKLTSLTVTATVKSDYVSSNEDATLYLMELEAWSGNSIPADKKPVAQSKLSGGEITFTCDLDPALDKYDSFVVAAKDGAIYTALSEAHFIDDPSVFAPADTVYPEPAGKKGLVCDDTGTIILSGASQTVLSVRLDDLMLPASAAADSVSFIYAGNTYYASRAVLDRLDADVRVLSDAGVNIFGQISLSGKYIGSEEKAAALYYPNAEANAQGYALNASSQTAINLYTAFVDFLAGRYCTPAGEYGFVGSWIIGLGADSNSPLNSAGDAWLDAYSESYQRAMRIADVAFRSNFAQARIYVPVSNNWNSRSSSSPLEYNVYLLLTNLTRNVKLHGDMPWRVALTATASDPTKTTVWNDEGATDENATKYITMKNVAQLIAFLDREDVKYNGEGRNLAVTGFAVNSSPDSPGDMTPSASFAYAYYKAAFNDRIDALIYSVARDDPSKLYTYRTPVTGEDGSVTEQNVSTALYFGLFDSSGAKKPIYDVFRNIDAALVSDQNYKAGDVTSFALSIIGIPDWGRAVPGFSADEAAVRNVSEAMPILSSDIPSKAKVKFAADFEGGEFNGFYPAGAVYTELRTVENQNGDASAMLYAGLTPDGGSGHMGVACPLNGLASENVKYVTFDVFVEAPSEVTSISVSVSVMSGGDQFVGTAAVKPNSWQEITFRCEDFGKRAAAADLLTIYVSSYDGADHAGSWGLILDNVETYGVKKSAFWSVLGKLLLAVIIIAVLLVIALFVLRVINVRRAKKRRAEAARRRAQRAATERANPQQQRYPPQRPGMRQ